MTTRCTAYNTLRELLGASLYSRGLDVLARRVWACRTESAWVRFAADLRAAGEPEGDAVDLLSRRDFRGALSALAAADR
jgi:hypothetical protein